MVYTSTTTAPILELIPGECWAQRQLRRDIMDVSMASKLMKSLTLVGVVFIGTLETPELDGIYLHNHCSDPGTHCGSLLGSTPATHWQPYKGRLCRMKAHEIADPCESCLYRYHSDPRTRWHISSQPLLRSWLRLRAVVRLNASYAAV